MISTNNVRLPRSLEIIRRFDFPHKIGILERLYGQRLAQLGRCRVRTFAGIDWQLNLHSPSHRRAVFSEYLGSEEACWIRRWLSRGGSVVDVGANIGQTVMLFAPCPDVEVIAIDPNPECIKWIRDCLASYGSWKVRTINAGLSDEPGKLTLYVPDFEGEEGGQATMRSDWYVNKGKSGFDVPVNTIDQLLESMQVPQVRLWKIDVEGWERNVLQGARRLFSEKRIDAVYAEVHPTNIEFFQDFMNGFGFTFHSIGKAGKLMPLIGKLPPAQDYLAIRSDLNPE